MDGNQVYSKVLRAMKRRTASYRVMLDEVESSNLSKETKHIVSGLLSARAKQLAAEGENVIEIIGGALDAEDKAPNAAEELVKAFEEHDDEFLNFENVENKLSERPDLHAFILLDRLVPGRTDMVSAAEHDEIYLDVNIESLAEAITKEQVLELVRCGVRVDSYHESLCMFV